LIEEKEQAINDLAAQVTSLTAQLAQKDKQIAALTAQIQELNLQIAQLQSANADLTNQISQKDDQIAALTAQLAAYQDTLPPAGSLHVADRWASNSKSVELTISGYVRDELSIIRDSGGSGVSTAYITLNGVETFQLTLDDSGTFSLTHTMDADKDAEYTFSLYAADTKEGTTNLGLVDQVTVCSPKTNDKGSGK